MKKVKRMLVCAVMVGTTMLTVPAVMAEEVIISAETQVGGDTAVIQSYIYEWRYKFETEHVYKRLYNCTKSCWVGDWILVY